MTTIRRPGVASAAVLIGLSASMVGAHLLAPEWSRRVGLDVWNYAAAEDDRRGAAERRAEVDGRAERAAQRRAVADQLAARLVARDAALATVAGDLLALFRDDAGSRNTLSFSNPGVRDLWLLYARHAIERVGHLLEGDPARCAAVCARLEGDYREMEAGQASSAE